MEAATSTVPKLDTRHGFFQVIVKNQLDRDNYDKEVKKKSAPPVKQKRPERQCYVPPSRRRGEVQELEGEKSPGSDILNFTYTDEFNGKHFYSISTRSDVEKTASSICRQLGYSESKRQCLANFLKKHMEQAQLENQKQETNCTTESPS